MRSAASVARLRSCRIATTATPRRAQRRDRFEHVELMLQVEARGRLVEQQQARPVRGLAAGELHQHAGEMRALLLAARQRRDDAVAERREIDVGERRSARSSIARPWRSPAPMRTTSPTVNGNATCVLCDSTARCSASSRGG